MQPIAMHPVMRVSSSIWSVRRIDLAEYAMRSTSKSAEGGQEYEVLIGYDFIAHRVVLDGLGYTFGIEVDEAADGLPVIARVIVCVCWCECRVALSSVHGCLLYMRVVMLNAWGSSASTLSPMCSVAEDVIDLFASALTAAFGCGSLEEAASARLVLDRLPRLRFAPPSALRLLGTTCSVQIGESVRKSCLAFVRRFHFCSLCLRAGQHETAPTLARRGYLLMSVCGCD